MDGEFGTRDDRFHEGYVKGLRDAGMTGMTTSMHNLAQRPASNLGYSAGYMQGFRDGNSGVFGDKMSNQLLHRLKEQYPNEDEFHQGYIDGFREGTKNDSRRFEDSRKLQQSLTELTERLTSLEKTKGDEIHSTKIYHVYNQHPEMIGYSATGEQLARELEELASTSRRSTLRRHYTPGDYLKYAGEEGGYNSLGHNRRSLSASALGRGWLSIFLFKKIQFYPLVSYYFSSFNLIIFKNNGLNHFHLILIYLKPKNRNNFSYN